MTSQRDLEDRIEEVAQELQARASAQALSPSQRAAATWCLEEPDRLLGGFALSIPEALGITDVTSRAYYRDARSYLYVNLLAALEWSNELLVLRMDPYVEAEALGGELVYPENGQPWLERPLLERPEDLSRCRLPNPLEDGRMPVVVEIAALHGRYLGDVVPACISCHSPFSLAVMMRGFDGLLEDAERDPLFVHDLLQFCFETSTRYGSAILEAGETYLTLVAPWEPLLRRDAPELFDEFALPYLSRCVAALRERHGQFGPLLWSRGSTQVSQWGRYLAMLRGTGISALTAGEEEIFGWESYRRTDLSALKRALASLGLALAIQLSPDTVAWSSPDDLRRHVRSLFEKAGAGGGLLLMTTLPVDARDERIQAFSDAVHACRYETSTSQDP